MNPRAGSAWSLIDPSQLAGQVGADDLGTLLVRHSSMPLSNTSKPSRDPGALLVRRPRDGVVSANPARVAAHRQLGRPRCERDPNGATLVLEDRPTKGRA